MAEIENFDEDAFRQSVARNASTALVRDTIYDLVDFAKNNADKIKGGMSQNGSFHYQINIAAQTLTLFTCDASGYVSVSLGNFDRQPRIKGKTIAGLRTTLAKITGFDNFSKDYPSRPGFDIAKSVVNVDAMVRFQRAIRKFQRDAQEY